MSHAHIMLLDSFLRQAWYWHRRLPLSAALIVDQRWATGARYIRSEKV